MFGLKESPVVGYKLQGYFPVKLAQPFLEFALNGEEGVTKEALVSVFLNFIPEVESSVLQKALDNFDEVETDGGLGDTLESHNVRVQVTKENIRVVIEEVAHKELVQAPAYVAECWHDILSNELKPLMKASFDEMRQQMEPTTANVLRAIIFPDEMNEAQKSTEKYMKRYIKSLGTEKLGRLLRFLTGKYMYSNFCIQIEMLGSCGLSH